MPNEIYMARNRKKKTVQRESASQNVTHRKNYFNEFAKWIKEYVMLSYTSTESLLKTINRPQRDSVYSDFCKRRRALIYCSTFADYLESCEISGGKEFKPLCSFHSLSNDVNSRHGLSLRFRTAWIGMNDPKGKGHVRSTAHRREREREAL